MNDDWTTNECRDITWSVNFYSLQIVNGCEVHFSDLTETEQDIILNEIRNDSYSGTF